MERKSKILEIIRSLDLPNNPLDDIIDQVVTMCGLLCVYVRTKQNMSLVLIVGKIFCPSDLKIPFLSSVHKYMMLFESFDFVWFTSFICVISSMCCNH